MPLGICAANSANLRANDIGKRYLVLLHDGLCQRAGRQFFLNIYTYVSHDCGIDDYLTFAPNVS